MVGKTLGHYEILEPLGAGGMGEVYRARDTTLKRDVAIKVLPEELAKDSERIARFETEAKLLASLNHPNIAAIYELADVDGLRLLVLEFVDGVSLDEALKEGPAPLDDALRIGRQVAAALQAAHDEGIVHRDLKPANVMLDSKGTAKVLDFGIAQPPREKDSQAPRRLKGEWGSGAIAPPTNEQYSIDMTAAMTMAENLTATGMLLGTAPYMSPEQVRGRSLDKRSDIWAFGCLMFELLTGGRPFDEPALIETFKAILEREPNWDRLPPETPASLRTLIRRCLRKDVDQRLHDIADARIEIDELAQTGTFEASAPDSRASWRWRFDLATAAAITAVLLALIALDVGGVRGRWFAGTSGAELTSSLESIGALVVLPSTVTPAVEETAGLFVQRESRGADEYLTDAIPATLSSRLVAIEGLEVRAPPSRVEFDSIRGDVDKIAEIYGVGALIRSTVVTDVDSVALTVEIVDAETGLTLWSHDYLKDRDAYFEMIDEAADDLRATMRSGAPVLASRDPDASRSAAELEYRKGRYHASRFVAYGESRDFDRAKAAFERSLAADPRLGDAAAEIGLLYASMLAAGGSSDGQVWSSIEEWASRAQSIDASSGLAWAVLAGVERWYLRDGHEGRRIEYLLRAATLAPDSPVVQNMLGMSLAEFSLTLGAEALEKASRLDPLFLNARANLVGSLATAGRAEEALEAIDAIQQIEPGVGWALMTRGVILAMLGRVAEATSIVADLDSLAARGRFDPVALLELRLEHALAAGDQEAAEAVLESIESAIGSPETPGGLIWNLVVAPSSALAVAGEVDAAFGILALGDRRGVVLPLDYLMLNPRLESLREDPRYAEVVEPARRHFEEVLAILEAARSRGEMPAYLEAPLDTLRERLNLAASAQAGT